MMIGTTTALPDEGEIQNMDGRYVIFFSSKRVRKNDLLVSCEKVSPEIESLRKTVSKTALLTILVSLMMIETTTALPDEVEIYKKNT